MMPRNSGDDYRVIQLEQALAEQVKAYASLRESFDAIQGVSLVQSQERIKELEERNLFLEEHAASFAGIADDEVAKREKAEWRLNEVREQRDQADLEVRDLRGKVAELEAKAKKAQRGKKF